MITLDALELPEGLQWVDEIGWSPVVQSEEYTVTGSMIVDTSERLAGRPITLSGTNSNSSWATRQTILTLMEFADEIGREMVLTLNDGREFDVIFRRNDGLPVEGEPIAERSVYTGEDEYTLTLRLMEI